MRLILLPLIVSVSLCAASDSFGQSVAKQQDVEKTYICYCTEGVVSSGKCSSTNCGTTCTLPCYCPLILPASGGNVTVQPSLACVGSNIVSGYYFALDASKGNVVDLSRSTAYSSNGNHPALAEFSVVLATDPPSFKTQVSTEILYDPDSGIASVNRYCSGAYDQYYRESTYVFFSTDIYSGYLTVTEEKPSTCPKAIAPTRQPTIAPFTRSPTRAPTEYNNYFCLCDPSVSVKEPNNECTFVSSYCGYKCTGPCYCPLPRPQGTDIYYDLTTVYIPDKLENSCDIWGLKENSLIGYYYPLDSENGNKIYYSDNKGEHDAHATFKAWYVPNAGDALDKPVNIHTSFSNDVYSVDRYCSAQQDSFYKDTVLVAASFQVRSGSIKFTQSGNSSCPSQ